MNIKGTILSRIGWIYILALIGGLGVLGKVLYLQLAQGDEWKEKAERMSQRTVSIPANRGNILDADGNPISSTVPTYDLAMDPNSSGMSPEVYESELPGLARGLSEIFGDKTPWEYQNKIKKARANGKRYEVLQTKISHKQARKVRNLPLFRHGQYKGGLILVQNNTRQRPYELLAFRTIGYVQGGAQGKKVGLEGKFDSYLKGEDGLRYEYRVGGNNWVPASTENFIEPQDGYDIVTTLDMNYQDVAEKALYDLLVDKEAHHGCAILMEVATGEIKAMANLTKESEGVYTENFNYAVGERTEPGSTFKLPALLAAIEGGYVDLDDTVDTYNGVYRFYGNDIKDSRRGGYGLIDVKTVFEKSSNIGMGKLIEKNFKDKPQEFIDRIYAMGLKYPTGIEVDGERNPLIRQPGDPGWSAVSLFYMAYGYGLELTPLQILTYYNAIANGGKMVAPRLVKEIKYHSHLIKTYGPEVIKNSICSKSTIDKAKTLLEGVVTNGTATNLESKAYKIAGKTGTAVIAQRGGYAGEDGGKEYRASFVGYFPADNPTYSCIVVVAKPQKQYYGNVVAGSVFLEIADKVYATDIRLHPEVASYSWEPSEAIPEIFPGKVEAGRILLKEIGMEFEKRSDPSAFASVNVNSGKGQFTEISVSNGIVPDVTGMGLTDALPLLENEGLKVNIKGYGRIVSQSLPPGGQIRKGQIIELKLELG